MKKNIHPTAIFSPPGAMVTANTLKGEQKMNVERTYDDGAIFLDLFMPLVYSEIDRLLEQEANSQYNEGNANTSHSEGAA